VFDEEVVCTADGPVWSVSRDPRDLGRAMSAAAALRGARQAVAGPSPDAEELVLAEPLATSAPLARALAPAVCRPLGPGVPDCSSYHGWVQYMRLLDLVQSPQRHGQFYRSNLAALARSGKRRVLVAGAADYSMLAHVLAAYEEAGQTADITVIDRCPTPLRLCHWYARLKSVAIHTEVANVCDFESAEPFDVICTDALLVMLSSSDKPRALSHLAGALRPGGRLITTIRIAPAAEGGPQRFDEEGAVAFAARAREEAARRAGLLDVDGEVLAREAHRYVSGIVVYPARSPEQLVELYGGAGLRLEELRILELAGRTTAQEGGPGVHQTGTYARMVATRD
jgi:SAM-dependent methyltransferase